MIDQTQLAEDLSSKIKYEFRQMFLVKPLEPVKVKKKISEPVVKDTKPKKDKDGIEAVDYDEVKTEIKKLIQISLELLYLSCHMSIHTHIAMRKYSRCLSRLVISLYIDHLEVLCISICLRTLNLYRFTIL